MPKHFPLISFICGGNFSTLEPAGNHDEDNDGDDDNGGDDDNEGDDDDDKAGDEDD